MPLQQQINVVTAQEVSGMVSHWLLVDPNTYLGSDYGSGTDELLQNPQLAGIGDAYVAKMLLDVPVLAALPAGAVNIYFQAVDLETNDLLIQLGSSLISYNQVNFNELP